MLIQHPEKKLAVFVKVGGSGGDRSALGRAWGARSIPSIRRAERKISGRKARGDCVLRVAVPLWLSDDCGWKRALRPLEIQSSYHNKTELGDRSVKGAIAERVFLKLLYRTSVNVAVC